MSTYTEVVSAALRQCVDPISARDLSDLIGFDIDSSRVSKSLYQLCKTGRAAMVGEETPPNSKPVRLYLSLEERPTAEKSSVVEPQKQAPALDSSDWPDAVEEWPGDAAASVPVRRHNDPTITEIEREGYRLLEPHQQGREVASRVKAGMPFVGQKLAAAVPTWWAALEELVAMHLEGPA